jgi:hypothetical protein
MRHGVSLDEMAGPQRALALALLRESLSAGGFRTARDVMKLNELVLELTGSREEYGEWLYWLSLMGTPADDGPWGWQLDGHHLIVNCFVLGDQVVMTPLFMGSEPVAAPDGTRVFQAEEEGGLALRRALTGAQREIALDNDEPSRQHIHTVVRTPNGNDYRRDLLREHHAQFDHSRATHRH